MVTEGTGKVGLDDFLVAGNSIEELVAQVENDLRGAPLISMGQQDSDHAVREAWPEPLDDAAYHGLAGEIVSAIDPTTEADPVAVLLILLTAFGNAVGSAPYWEVSGKRHGLRLNTVLVGKTSKGRKGTAVGSIKPIFRVADPEWAENCLSQGLSTGEGLIWAVRDPVIKREPIKEKGRVVDYQEIEDDPGVADKRLLVIEEEFASTLKVMRRDGNTLSAVIRQAWDDGDIRTLTKNSPARTTGAHISILAHITAEELVRELNSTEAANGFANRNLWACVRRSKLLPDGGQLDAATVEALGGKLRESLEVGRRIDRVERDANANEIWRAAYGPLSEGGHGLMGAILGRAEAQVARLATVYAVMDGSSLITPDHLRAGLAVWEYCEQSVELIFGDKFGDSVADTILNALRRNGQMSRTDIRDLFKRHESSARIDDALDLLRRTGKADFRKEKTGGRDREIWYAI